MGILYVTSFFCFPHFHFHFQLHIYLHLHLSIPTSVVTSLFFILSFDPSLSLSRPDPSSFIRPLDLITNYILTTNTVLCFVKTDQLHRNNNSSMWCFPKYTCCFSLGGWKCRWGYKERSCDCYDYWNWEFRRVSLSNLDSFRSS